MGKINLEMFIEDSFCGLEIKLQEFLRKHKKIEIVSLNVIKDENLNNVKAFLLYKLGN